MAPALRSRRRLVRHGQMLTYSQLREQARKAVRGTGKTHADIAEDMDKTTSAVSLAVTQEGPKYAKLQQAIIARYTEYTVRPAFVAERKGREETAAGGE